MPMLRKLAIVVLILAVIGAAVFWFVTIPATVPASALPAYAPNLENGKTMFYAGGCSSCHAIPNQEDKTRLGGGLGLKSPFGTFYAPNISPDRSDGIGDWSEANFVTAMLKGTSPDGSHYYPAFPYTSYQRMRMEDVRDLFAYLKTLPPVQGKVRGHDLPIYLKYRRLVGGWKFLFLDGQPFKPDPSKSAQWKAATAGFPTLRRRGSAITRKGTSSASSKPATCRTAIRSEAPWRPSSGIPRNCRPRIAPRWRIMSNRCRWSKGRSIRSGDRSKRVAARYRCGCGGNKAPRRSKAYGSRVAPREMARPPGGTRRMYRSAATTSTGDRDMLNSHSHR
jgi:mono/diheme cytochrome c family protein